MHEIHYNNETHSFAFMRQRTYLMAMRSEEHTSELQSQSNLVCRLLLEKKKNVVYIFVPLIAHGVGCQRRDAGGERFHARILPAAHCRHTRRDVDIVGTRVDHQSAATHT